MYFICILYLPTPEGYQITNTKYIEEHNELFIHVVINKSTILELSHLLYQIAVSIMCILYHFRVWTMTGATMVLIMRWWKSITTKRYGHSTEYFILLLHLLTVSSVHLHHFDTHIKYRWCIQGPVYE